MGYETRPGVLGHTIRTFTPDDTDTELYFDSTYRVTLSEIIEKAREKWGADISLDQLNISAKHIHTDCLGYDRYDPSDYTDYIVITRNVDGA